MIGLGILVLMLIACLPGWLAWQRGYSFAIWWAFAFLLPPFAMARALRLPDKSPVVRNHVVRQRSLRPVRTMKPRGEVIPFPGLAVSH